MGDRKVLAAALEALDHEWPERPDDEALDQILEDLIGEEAFIGPAGQAALERRLVGRAPTFDAEAYRSRLRSLDGLSGDDLAVVQQVETYIAALEAVVTAI